MSELSITVILEGQNEATYRFSESPVLIGRSPEAHLNICHEAVARELGYAWIEDDGRTVRLEERPGLTNELVCGKNVVQGGISGRRIEVSVGPVRLMLEPAFSNKSKEMSKQPSRKVMFFGAAIIFSGLVVFVVLNLAKTVEDRSDGTHILPSSPFCQNETIQCAEKSACLEKARLYVTRARELLSRPQNTARQRVRAATMLLEATAIYEAHQGSQKIGIDAEVEDEIAKINIAYQKERIALTRALQNRQTTSPAAAKVARQLLEYLADCEGTWTPWLEEISSYSENKGKKR